MKSLAWRLIILAALAFVLIHQEQALLSPIFPNETRWPDEAAVNLHIALDNARSGVSIYDSPVDLQMEPESATSPGWRWFRGYKAGPLLPRLYQPLLKWGDFPVGLYLTNLGFFLLAVATAFFSTRRLIGLNAALFAMLLSLAWPSSTTALFDRGATDLPAALLATWAVLFAGREYRIPAGLFLGLSIACQPLPGAALLPVVGAWFVGKRLRGFAVGLLLGLSPYLPSLFTSSGSLFASLIEWPLRRPVSRATLLGQLNANFRIAALCCSCAVLAALAYWVYRRSRAAVKPESYRDVRPLLVGSVEAILLLLLFGTSLGTGDLLWLLPLVPITLSVLMAGTFTSR